MGSVSPNTCVKWVRLMNDSIWGPDVASIKGKSTWTPPHVPVATLHHNTHTREPQTLSIDIMFIDRIPILIGVAYPLDLTLAANLTLDNNITRNAAAIQQAILSFTGTLLSQGYRTALIMSDGEKSVGKLRTQLNHLGIEIDVSGAGGHVARVERRIRTVKEATCLITYRSHHQHSFSPCALYSVFPDSTFKTQPRVRTVPPRDKLLPAVPLTPPSTSAVPSAIISWRQCQPHLTISPPAPKTASRYYQLVIARDRSK